ncbi:signal peptidase II [Brevibacillus fluminis]|uniref:Lipoprotein signal peptidase n=1 Tax=Brevibacillus fluminis TaxID=511487 RepID=A0A3M8DWE2_9BACL|nr:signal peptidase II [Brevibacillus fluminis]RNB91307.1 signal peptidase II [Brevibacillus fluminis]
MIYYLYALAVILLDQLTKYAIVKNMVQGESIPLIDNVFQLTSHRNMGAAFGILQNQRILFIIITLAVVTGIIVTLFRIGRTQPRISLGLSLVLGGAIGNFIDRALNGQVVDFLDFVLIHFPIFNVADAAITIGVVILLLDIFFDSKRTR